MSNSLRTVVGIAPPRLLRDRFRKISQLLRNIPIYLISRQVEGSSRGKHVHKVYDLTRDLTFADNFYVVFVERSTRESLTLPLESLQLVQIGRNRTRKVIAGKVEHLQIGEV